MKKEANKYLKNIEISLRKKFLGTINKGNTISSASFSHLELNNKSRILLLRQDRIGDVLISIPTIRLLRNKFPDAAIDILLSKNNIGTKKAVKPYVNNIYNYSRKILKDFRLLLKLRRQKYDLVIDLLEKASTTSSIILKIVKSKYSIGIAKDNSAIYTHPVKLEKRNELHLVERTASALLPLGIDYKNESISLEYFLSGEEKKAAVGKMGIKQKPLRLGINLSGSHQKKFWGIENNIKFIKLIEEHYSGLFEIFLFFTKDYSKEAESIAKEANIILAPSAGSFHEYAALLSTCDMLFSPDTAAIHLAAAWKIPVLALYIQTPEKENTNPWLPYNSKFRALFSRTDDITSIPVEDVLTAFMELCGECGLSRKS